MQIQCPRCKVAYDIPDHAIPDPGREVQCSACTHAWFLLRGGTPAQPRVGEGGPAAGGDATARPAVAMAPEQSQDVPGPDPDLPDPPRRKIDPEVLAILRTEAKIETKARQAERAAQPQRPSQTALTNATPPAAAPARSGASDRLARLTAAERAHPTGTGPDDDGLVEDPHAAWRDPRPPILSGSVEAPATTSTRSRRDLPVAVTPPHVLEARRRTGFRLGFGVTLGACCAALALYLLAAEYGGRAMPFADQIMAHGDRVQTALVDLLRKFLATGVS